MEILTQTKLTLLISAHYLLLEMIRSLIIIVIIFSLIAMNLARSNNHEASVPTEDDDGHHQTLSFMRTGITFTEGKKVFVAQDCRDVTILEVDEDTKKVNRLSYEEIKEVLAEKLQQG